MPIVRARGMERTMKYRNFQKSSAVWPAPQSLFQLDVKSLYYAYEASRTLTGEVCYQGFAFTVPINKPRKL